jgi:signal transduction histidine kinase
LQKQIISLADKELEHGKEHQMRSTFEFFKVTFSAPNRFEPASAEEKFLCDYAKRFLAHRRAMSILAVVYWSAFSLWDLAQAFQSDQFQHVVAYVLVLRLLGTICLVSCAWLSFRKEFANERYATAVLISMVGSTYILLGLMLLLLPFPMNYIYYSPGHFMVLIFAHGMFRLRAKPALRLTIALILFSEFIYAYMANDAVEQGERLFSAYYFLFSSLYLTSFAVIGCAIVVELERTARDAYSRQRQLGISNQSVLTKNAELEQLNSALEESKREMEAKTAALIAAKEEVRSAAVLASRQKSQFLADASHDLRQPMQALSSLLEAAQLALGRGDRETSSKLLSGAQTALRLARASFSSILDISRMETGFVEAECSSFPIDAFVAEVMEPLRVLAEEKGIKLRLRFGTKKSIVHSDQQQLSRVLTNLIGNAIKYSDPSKPNQAVLIGIVGLPNRARIDIVDNGIGIPNQHWDDVFRPFFQLGNPEWAHRRGTPTR